MMSVIKSKLLCFFSEEYASDVQSTTVVQLVDGVKQ